LYFAFLLGLQIAGTVVIGNSEVPEIPHGTSLELCLSAAASTSWDTSHKLFNTDGSIVLFIYVTEGENLDGVLSCAARRSGQPTVLVYNPFSVYHKCYPISSTRITNGAETAETYLYGCIGSAAVSDVVRSILKVAMYLPHVLEPLTEQEVGIGEALREWGARRLSAGEAPMVTIREAEMSIRAFPGCRFLDVDRCLARISAAAYVQVHPTSGMVLLDVPWVFQHVKLATKGVPRPGILRCGDMDESRTALKVVQVVQLCEWLVRCKVAIPLDEDRGGFMVFANLHKNTISFTTNYGHDLGTPILIGDGDTDEGLVLDGVLSGFLLWEVVNTIVTSGMMRTGEGLGAFLGFCQDHFLLRVRGATIRLNFIGGKRLTVVVSGPEQHNVLLRIHDIMADAMERNPTWASGLGVKLNILCARRDCMEVNGLEPRTMREFRKTGRFDSTCGHCEELSLKMSGLEFPMAGRWSGIRSAWIGAVARAIQGRRPGLVFNVHGDVV